jgi:hypothetical protein
VQPLWKKIWRLLKNLNIDLPYGNKIKTKILSDRETYSVLYYFLLPFKEADS